MDDWTYPYPDVEVPDTQRSLLHEGRRVMEARRARAQQAEAARVAELDQAPAFEAADSPAEADIPLPFATPPGVALTF